MTATVLLITFAEGSGCCVCAAQIPAAAIRHTIVRTDFQLRFIFSLFLPIVGGVGAARESDNATILHEIPAGFLSEAAEMAYFPCSAFE